MKTHMLLLTAMLLASLPPSTIGSFRQLPAKPPQERYPPSLLNPEFWSVTTAYSDDGQKPRQTCSEYTSSGAASRPTSAMLTSFIHSALETNYYPEAFHELLCIENLVDKHQKSWFYSYRLPLHVPECSTFGKAPLYCAFNILWLAAEHPNSIDPKIFDISQQNFITSIHRVLTSESFVREHPQELVKKLDESQKGRFKTELILSRAWNREVLVWLSKNKDLRGSSMFDFGPNALSVLFCLHAYDTVSKLPANASADAVKAAGKSLLFRFQRPASPLVVSPRRNTHHDTSEHPPFNFKQNKPDCSSRPHSMLSLLVGLKTTTSIPHDTLVNIYDLYITSVNGIGPEELHGAIRSPLFQKDSDLAKIWNSAFISVLEEETKGSAKNEPRKIFTPKSAKQLTEELKRQGRHEFAQKLIVKLAAYSVL